MSSNANHFEAQLTIAWPPERWVHHRVIIAVSGGADSVALLRGLVEAADQADSQDEPVKLVVAHFNHRWRGEESDGDERFVAALADKFGLQFFCERANSPAKTGSQRSNSGSGAEALARDARYDFLRRTAMSAGARYIATAHNQQDQVETIVQRIFRGTGIRGLCGIPPVRSIGDGISLVRPLLSVGRETIESYLKRISQRYRVDSSNAETAYTRNQVRHEVLPALRQHFGQQVDQNLLQLAQHANDSQQVIDQLSQDLAASAVSYASDGVTTIDRALISKQPSHLVCELFREIWRHNRWPQRDMDAFKWQQLTILTVGKQGKTLTFPGNIRATADQKNLTLARSG